MKHIGKYVKSVCLVAICVVMVFASFGCDGQEMVNPDDVEVVNAKVEGTITLSCPVDVYATDSAKASISQWVSNFRSMYPGVTVKEEFTARDNWASRIAAKDIGDVFYTEDGSIYDQAVINKSAMKLDSFVERFSKDTSFGLNTADVFAGILKLGEVDGSLYMVATSCGQNTFTYNKGLLEQKQLAMPTNDWSWSQFKDYIKELTIAGDDGSLNQVGAAMRLYMSYDSSMYIPFFQGFGGQWCDTVNKKVTLIDDEKVLKGVNELVSVLEAKQIYPMNTQVEFTGDYATAFSKINNDNLLSTAAFVQLGAFSGLGARAAQYEAQGIDWDVVAFPTFEAPAVPCGSNGYCVFSYTDNPAASAALVLSMYTQNGQRALNSGAGGGVPLLSSLSTEEFWKLQGAEYEGKNFDAFVSNTEQYVPAQIKNVVPADVAQIIIDGMGDLFKALYQGTASVDNSLTNMQTAANQKWSTLK